MITILLLGVSILIGFNAGYFLKAEALIVLSFICVVIGIFGSIKYRGLESLKIIIFIYFAVIINITMAITWYFRSENTYLKDFFTLIIN
jgi:hypothetical protein